MQRRTVLILGGILGVIVIGGAAWYLGSPLILDRTVDEELPFEIPSEAEMETMSEEELEMVSEKVLSTAAAMPDKEMEDPMPEEGQLVTLKSGEFQGADDFHQGSGAATIYELPDGSRVLRFEDFMVTNGPDLHVFLAAGSSPTGREDLGQYLDLGPLKGNIGDQNYEIPAAADLDLYNSVVIYCVPFHVLFAYADL
jgi:hypothetical protein